MTETTAQTQAEVDSRVQLGEYVTTSIRGELTRTNATATCLLTTLSIVGSASAAGLGATAGTRQPGVATIVVLAVALGLLGAALLLILAALRPRLPRPWAPTTGWPQVPRLSREEYDQAADEFAEFVRADALTLAAIARKKFLLIRRAYDLAIAGLPVLVLGILLWL